MTPKRPPIHTELVELTHWTLDRTTAFPRSHRFTFGQRLDNLCLDTITEVTLARYATRENTRRHLNEVNLNLELMRVLWSIIQEKEWISARQSLFVHKKIDSVGMMAGAWIKSLNPK